MVAHLGAFITEVDTEDLGIIAQPLDFLGVNYYFPQRVAPSPDRPEGFRALTAGELVTDHRPLVAGWESDSDALASLLHRLSADYGPRRIIISENGASGNDRLDANGHVNDWYRRDYIRGHLAAVADAAHAGVPVVGYFVWTLMDNFEWSQGFARRFGLYFTDYSTLELHPKQSAVWYQEVAAARRFFR
jgi:beta-glucosidase